MSKLAERVDDFFREHPGEGTRITLTLPQWNELRAQLAADNNARRERIAARIMAALVANEHRGRNVWPFDTLAADACDAADALAAELDARGAK